MKILVCLSVVPDTTTKIKFTDKKSLDKAGVQLVINPWDELVLTRALELKEIQENKIESVTVVTVGLQETDAVIRKALAIGADNAIRINAEAKDSYYVATQIFNAVKELKFDIILAGIESSDYNGSSVGAMLAELLAYTNVSSVSNLNISNDSVTIKREIEGGSETLQVQIPVLLVCQKGISIEPRIPSMRGIMAARTKPLQVIEPANADTLVDYTEFELPKPKSVYKKIDPENVKELINLLHNEAKVI